MTGRAVPTLTLENELQLACSLGVVASYEMHPGRRNNTKRMWHLVLADGSVVNYGPKSLEAFMLGVRSTHEAHGEIT